MTSNLWQGLPSTIGKKERKKKASSQPNNPLIIVVKYALLSQPAEKLWIITNVFIIRNSHLTKS